MKSTQGVMNRKPKLLARKDARNEGKFINVLLDKHNFRSNWGRQIVHNPLFSLTGKEELYLAVCASISSSHTCSISFFDCSCVYFI